MGSAEKVYGLKRKTGENRNGGYGGEVFQFCGDRDAGLPAGNLHIITALNS